MVLAVGETRLADGLGHAMIDCKPVFVLAAGLALSALPGASRAQLSPDNGPVNASAIHNRIETDSQTGVETMYLDDQVEILQNGRRLRCDHAKIIQAPRAGGQGGKDIVQMEATGNVFYVADDQNARGDYAIYVKADDTLKVTGNVILQRGKSVATGNLLVDQVHAGLISLTADANSADHGRVRAVMYTDKKPDDAPAAKAGTPSHP